MDYNKWLKHTFSSGTSVGRDYVEFQKRMKSGIVGIIYSITKKKNKKN